MKSEKQKKMGHRTKSIPQKNKHKKCSRPKNYTTKTNKWFYFERMRTEKIKKYLNAKWCKYKCKTKYFIRKICEA